MRLEITGGAVEVSKEDYAWAIEVGPWHFNGAGYATRRPYIGGGKGAYRPIVFMHRQILERMLGRELQPGELTDHRNRDRKDNRRPNLRPADYKINANNRDPDADYGGWRGIRKHRPKKDAETGRFVPA